MNRAVQLPRHTWLSMLRSFQPPIVRVAAQNRDAGARRKFPQPLSTKEFIPMRSLSTLR